MADPRAVVIGYGMAGRSFHSYLIHITPGLTLHGVASSSAEKRRKIQQEYGCKAYKNIDEVLQDPDVDLVVLATPNHVHAEYAIRAMQAGKNVVTDKPMCLSLAEADEMLTTAKATGRVLSIFQNRRWDGDFLTAKKLLDEGQLGSLLWVEMAWQRWGAPVGWRGEATQGGGRFLDLGAHLLDQLLLLIPSPVQAVYCRMHYDFAARDVESHAMIVLHFANGATGICDMNSVSAIPKPRFQLFGDKATFVKYGLDPQEEQMKAGNIDAAVEESAFYGRLHNGTQESVIPTMAGRWRSYYENIRDVLTVGAELAVKPEEVRRVMAVFDAAQRSAASNQVVEIAL